MARTDSRRSPFRFLFTLLLVLVVAAGVYGGFLYMSYRSIQDHITAATTSYDQCLAQLENEHYGDALTSIHTTVDEVDQIRTDLDGWQWEVAEHLPYLSQDVTCARQTARIADELAGNAVLPVVEQAESILGDVGSDDPLTGMGNALTKLPALYTAITDARKVVGTCKTEADQLGTSHLDALNEWVGSVKTATTEADAAFAQFDLIFGAIDSLGEIANSLTTTTEPTIAG